MTACISYSYYIFCWKFSWSLIDVIVSWNFKCDIEMKVSLWNQYVRKSCCCRWKFYLPPSKNLLIVYIIVIVEFVKKKFKAVNRLWCVIMSTSRSYFRMFLAPLWLELHFQIASFTLKNPEIDWQHIQSTTVLYVAISFMPHFTCGL